MIRYEHPGREDANRLWFSNDRCRWKGSAITRIGYSDNDAIPRFKLVLAEPSPNHMRPARRYSIMFPHDVVTGFPMALVQSAIFSARQKFDGN